MRMPNIVSNLKQKMDSKLGGTHSISMLQGGGGGDPETRSTISSSELLPPYSPMRIESTAMAVAKLITRTLLLITLIISLLVLLTVYIQTKNSNARCDYGISAKESRNGAYYEPLTAESGDPDDTDSIGTGRKIPISIRMSGRAGDLMSAAPNGKGHVNCVIERKTANQIIASEPKKLATPFGNITTDPRLIHLTGEKLVFSCHSGDKDDKEEKEKNVIIITNDKEIIDPRGDDDHHLNENGDERDNASHGTASSADSRENEIELNAVKSREKRSANKELSCNCAC